MILYNEIEPYPAQWLRNLCAADLIAPGDVLEADIRTLTAERLAGATQVHFFAGIGVWSHALRLAGWPDDVPVWTGSCPCQPFSVAGRRKGKGDARHLWPDWFRLIEKCRPPIVVGEQVASPDGLAWFDTVSSDLEGAGYAVGAADLCAAGVGAPHIRQRLYFAAIADRQRCEGLDALLQRRGSEQDCVEAAGCGAAGGLAHSSSKGLEIGGKQSPWQEQSPLERGSAVGVMGDASGQRGGRDAGAIPSAEGIGSGEGQQARRVSHESVASGYTGGFWAGADWLYCRDGKHRPTQPGLFALADGTSFRLADGRSRAGTSRPELLKGIGNAIVPQVAATFIRGVMQCL